MAHSPVIPATRGTPIDVSHMADVAYQQVGKVGAPQSINQKIFRCIFSFKIFEILFEGGGNSKSYFMIIILKTTHCICTCYFNLKKGRHFFKHQDNITK
jgi:hypothetical protein